MPQKFTCSHCKNDLVVLKLDVGKYARCPECKEWNEVPESLQETSDMLNCKIDKKQHVDEQVFREKKFNDFLGKKKKAEEDEINEDEINEDEINEDEINEDEINEDEINEEIRDSAHPHLSEDNEPSHDNNPVEEGIQELINTDSEEENKKNKPEQEGFSPLNPFLRYFETHSLQDTIHISPDSGKPEKINTFRDYFEQLSPNIYATPGLIIFNVLIFCIMIIAGVSPFTPDLSSILPWGIKYTLFIVENGEWWRLFTSIFVHIGVFHLIINMAGLWILGSITERLYGSITFALIFLVGGLGGNVVSLFLNAIGPSAGGSGAIMGALGALIPFVMDKDIPLSKRLAQQATIFIILFASIYFIFGFFVSFIDNAGHIGGLSTGCGLGFILKRISRGTPIAENQEDKRKKNMILGGIGLGIFILGIGGGIFFLKPFAPLLEIYTYFQKQEYGNALGVIRENPEALKKIPGGNSLEAIIYGNTGWEKYLEGDFQQCIDLSEKAYELDPVNAFYARYNIALCYLRLGRIEKSKELYRELENEKYGMEAENRKGVVQDLQDLIDKGVYADEAAYILKEILKVQNIE